MEEGRGGWQAPLLLDNSNTSHSLFRYLPMKEVIVIDIYNMRVFNYGDSVQVRLYNKLIKSGCQPCAPPEGKERPFLSAGKDKCPDPDPGRSVDSSVSRTKNKLYGIARANMWDLFITLTFDRALTDSADYGLVSRRTRKWLNNLRERHCPDLKYLMVPELHKDGEHWHVHGLLADVGGLQLAPSGIVKAGKEVYNLPGWQYGFSTATYVEDAHRVSSYICKYITKDLAALTQHRKRFWSSANCTRIDDVASNYVIESEELFFKEFGDKIGYVKGASAPAGGLKVKYLEVSPD